MLSSSSDKKLTDRTAEGTNPQGDRSNNNRTSPGSARQQGLREVSMRAYSYELERQKPDHLGQRSSDTTTSQPFSPHPTEWPENTMHSTVAQVARNHAERYGSYEASYEAVLNQLSTSTTQEGMATWEKYQKEERIGFTKTVGDAIVDAILENNNVTGISLTKDQYKDVQKYLADLKNTVITNEQYITCRKAAYNTTNEIKAARTAYSASDKGKAARTAYEASDEGKAAKAAYEASDKGKAARTAYSASDKGKAARTAYEASDKGKASRAAYIASDEGKAAIAAYNASDEGKAARAAWKEREALLENSEGRTKLRTDYRKWRDGEIEQPFYIRTEDQWNELLQRANQQDKL
jgi:hypothetical protein